MNKQPWEYQDNLEDKPHFFVISQLITLDRRGKYSNRGVRTEISLTNRPIYAFRKNVPAIAIQLCNQVPNLLEFRIHELDYSEERKHLKFCKEEELTKYL
jgi:hypothetical protein